MNFGTFTRRNFAGRLAAVLSSVSLTGAALADSAKATTDEGIRKLGDDGKPADRKQMITPIVVHNGLSTWPGKGRTIPVPPSNSKLDITPPS
jgi:hypothetical protein